MTTSWLEEPIANCGWFGLLLAPAGLACVCRFGDSFRWPALTMLTSLVAVLLLTVEITAFLALLAAWFGLCALLVALRVARAVTPEGRS